MTRLTSGAQDEGRSERATLQVTPHEKSAIRFVAGARGTTEAGLLRGTLIADVVAEYDRALDILRANTPKPAA